MPPSALRNNIRAFLRNNHTLILAYRRLFPAAPLLETSNEATYALWKSKALLARKTQETDRKRDRISELEDLTNKRVPLAQRTIPKLTKALDQARINQMAENANLAPDPRIRGIDKFSNIVSIREVQLHLMTIARFGD